MSIQDPSQLLRINLTPAQKLWLTLGKIQTSLNIDGVEMAMILRLTHSDFQKLRNQKKEPNVRSAMALCEHLNVGFERLMTGDIDYPALYQQYHGNKSYIPERYLVGAQGKRRIAADYLTRIEKLLGWQRRIQLMRHLQVNETFFSNPDDNINLNLTTDILQWVLSEYRNEGLLSEMGSGIVQAQCHGPIGKALGKTRNLQELYEMLTSEILGKYWEKNYLWHVHSITSENIIVRGHPNPEILGVVPDAVIKNYSTCVLRKGIMGAIPTFLGYPAQQAQKTKCVAKGDPFCEFHLDLNHLNRHHRWLRAVQ